MHEISQLRATGAEIVLTTDAYLRARGTTNTDRATDCENHMIRKVGRDTGARVADVLDYVCPHDRCLDKLDGVTLRADGLHYKGAGAQLRARWLRASVR